MSETREWTILIANNETKPCVSAVHVDNRHFVPGEKITLYEKSAYDQLLQRNGELLAEIAKRKEIGEATAKVLQECADREAELESENERLRRELSDVTEARQNAQVFAEINQKRTTLLELRAESATPMLLKYGRHLSSCLVEQVLEIHKPYCTCGWEEAKAALESEEKG